jgi:Na+/H+ antiporter
MHAVETLFGLITAAAALAAVAGKIGLPYPIVLVLGGLALGSIPGLPKVELPPDLVFLLFLPPLIYSAAVFTPLRDLRQNVRPIASLAIGLVLATMAIVGVVAHAAIPGVTWPAAFVLGAVVAASDAVATTAIAGRLGLPQRIATILEGESLVNDATALVAYRMAVGAVVTGSFSLEAAAPQFLLVPAGGAAVGLAVGWLAIALRRRVEDPAVDLTISLLTPFAAYLLAESLGFSGVLAVLAAGLYVEWLRPVMSASTRIQALALWQTLVFLLNGVLFIFLGLESRSILAQLSQWPTATLLWSAVVVCVTVITVRINWVWVSAQLLRILGRRWREREPHLPWQHQAVIAWGGLRGVDSLAAALALPLTTATGAQFPDRSLIIFLGCCAILASLVIQGLSLPLLIRRLEVADDGAAEREEVTARLAATRAALTRLDELAAQDGVSRETVERLRSRYNHRAGHLTAQADSTDDGSSAVDLSAHQRVKLDLLDAERRTVIQLRNRGVINDEVLRRIERDLDLEELRLEA